MNRRALTRVSVTISTEAEEAVIEMLARWFPNPAVIYSNAETGATQATVYLEDSSAWNPTVRRQLEAGFRQLAGGGLDPGSGRISVSKVRHEDWAESWKRHFRPIEIGRALLIKPTWSRRRPKPGQAVMELDPGLSFGTGHHATTSFCLRQLVAVRQPDLHQSILDIGTGSGILAIAAAKLGYQPVRAFDFDPEAIRVAKENVRLNQVTSLVKPTRQDLTRLPLAAATRYDVVCANLIFDLLIAERDRIGNRVKPAGRLVLAGILRSQFAPVRRAFVRAGWRLQTTEVGREWQSGAFARA